MVRNQSICASWPDSSTGACSGKMQQDNSKVKGGPPAQLCQLSLFFYRLQQPLVQMILDYDDVKGWNIWWQNGQRCQPQQVSNQAIKF